MEILVKGHFIKTKKRAVVVSNGAGTRLFSMKKAKTVSNDLFKNEKTRQIERVHQVFSKKIRREALKHLAASEMKISLDCRVFIRIGAVDGIFTDRTCVKFADRAICGIGRVGRADECAEIIDGIVFFQNCGDDRAARHEFDEFAVETALFVDFVKLARVRRGHLGELHRDDPEAVVGDHFKDVADMAICDGIGLEHGESAVT